MDGYTRSAALKVLGGLPPELYLQYCKSEDQIIHWYELRRHYCLLNQSFQEYFSGKAESQYYKLNEKDREIYTLLRDFYLKFYQLVQFCWRSIEQEFHERGKSLKTFASSPGEALIRVLENDAAAFFQVCLLPYYKWTPSESRNLREQDRRLQARCSRDKPDETLSRDIEQYQKRLYRATQPFLELLAFREICVDVCQQQKSSAAKKYLKEYRIAKSELDSELHSLFHPRKKRRGWEYVRGGLKISSAHGGVCR